jgi:hypothetical protein
VVSGTDGDGRDVVPSLPITDGLGLKVTAFFCMRGVFSVVVVEVEVEAIVAGDGWQCRIGQMPM